MIFILYFLGVLGIVSFYVVLALLLLKFIRGIKASNTQNDKNDEGHGGLDRRDYTPPIIPLPDGRDNPVDIDQLLSEIEEEYTRRQEKKLVGVS